MKNKKIKDERVIQLNNKIQSEAYFIVLFLLFVTIIIKANVFGMPFVQYATELGIIILSLLYIIVRSIFLGNNFDISFKYGKVLVVLSISILISIVGGIGNYIQYGNKYTGIFDPHFIVVIGVMFISSIIFLSIIFALIYLSNKIGENNIEKKIDKE